MAEVSSSFSYSTGPLPYDGGPSRFNPYLPPGASEGSAAPYGSPASDPSSPGWHTPVVVPRSPPAGFCGELQGPKTPPPLYVRIPPQCVRQIMVSFPGPLSSPPVRNPYEEVAPVPRCGGEPPIPPTPVATPPAPSAENMGNVDPQVVSQQQQLLNLPLKEIVPDLRLMPEDLEELARLAAGPLEDLPLHAIFGQFSNLSKPLRDKFLSLPYHVFETLVQYTADKVGQLALAGKSQEAKDFQDQWQDWLSKICPRSNLPKAEASQPSLQAPPSVQAPVAGPSTMRTARSSRPRWRGHYRGNYGNRSSGNIQR